MHSAVDDQNNFFGGKIIKILQTNFSRKYPIWLDLIGTFKLGNFGCDFLARK